MNINNEKIYKKYSNKISNNVNSKDNLIKSKVNKSIVNKNNINHNYFESSNIKADKKFSKNQNSFKNVFIPLQKQLLGINFIKYEKYKLKKLFYYVYLYFLYMNNSFTIYQLYFYYIF